MILQVMQVLQQALQQGSESSEDALKRALCDHFRYIVMAVPLLCSICAVCVV